MSMDVSTWWNIATAKWRPSENILPFPQETANHLSNSLMGLLTWCQAPSIQCLWNRISGIDMNIHPTVFLIETGSRFSYFAPKWNLFDPIMKGWSCVNIISNMAAECRDLWERTFLEKKQHNKTIWRHLECLPFVFRRPALLCRWQTSERPLWPGGPAAQPPPHPPEMKPHSLWHSPPLGNICIQLLKWVHWVWVCTSVCLCIRDAGVCAYV